MKQKFRPMKLQFHALKLRKRADKNIEEICLKGIFDFIYLFIEIIDLAFCQKRFNFVQKEIESIRRKRKMGVIHLTKEEFTAKVSGVLNGGGWNYLGDKPAIIDFFATWCGPCQALGPIFEEVATGKYADQVYFYKVDVDQEEELAALFNIRSVPTLLFIPMEGKPKISVGVMGKSDMERAIKEVLL